MPYPFFRNARAHKKTRRTSGDLTLNSTNWANVDTGLDIALPALVGDDIQVGLSAFTGSEAVNLYLDAVSVVGGAPVNSFGRAAAVEAAPGGLGIQSWLVASGGFIPLGSPYIYTVVAGDLSSGIITVRLRYATGTAANRTLRANANQPLQFWAKNLGPPA